MEEGKIKMSFIIIKDPPLCALLLIRNKIITIFNNLLTHFTLINQMKNLAVIYYAKM